MSQNEPLSEDISQTPFEEKDDNCFCDKKTMPFRNWKYCNWIRWVGISSVALNILT